MCIRATKKAKNTVAIVPIRSITFRSISPVAKAAPATAPDHGTIKPTPRLGIIIAIEAGLNPTCWAAGINMLARNVVAAVPENKFVPNAIR